MHIRGAGGRSALPALHRKEHLTTFLADKARFTLFPKPKSVLECNTTSDDRIGLQRCTLQSVIEHDSTTYLREMT